MKKILLPVLLFLLFGCKSSSQISKPPVILITSDGSFINEEQLQHLNLRIHPAAAAILTADTLDLWVNTGGTNPVPSNIPRFQKFIASNGQVYFPCTIPNVYFVVKNGIILDLTTHYTVSSSGITFTSPLKSGDVVKVIRLE